jgi:hypothetical protein
VGSKEIKEASITLKSPGAFKRHNFGVSLTRILLDLKSF